MASNGIPEQQITVTDGDSSTIIGLKAPTVFSYKEAAIDESGLNNYHAKIGSYISYRRVNFNKQIYILGSVPTYYQEASLVDDSTQIPFTKTFTLTDKTVDYIQLTLTAKMYLKGYLVNPLQRIKDDHPDLAGDGGQCLYDRIRTSFKLDPNITIDSVTFSDAGNQRTYTIRGNVRYTPLIGVDGYAPDQMPNVGPSLTGDEIGGIMTQWDFDRTYFYTIPFTTLIPNSQLGIINQGRMSRSLDVPTSQQATKTGMFTRLLKLFSK